MTWRVRSWIVSTAVAGLVAMCLWPIGTAHARSGEENPPPPLATRPPTTQGTVEVADTPAFVAGMNLGGASVSPPSGRGAPGVPSGVSSPPRPRQSGLDALCVREALTQASDPFAFCAAPPDPADPAEPAAPAVTANLVLQAFQEIPLPQPALVVQPPDGVTLVNLETNFYTEAAPFTSAVTLLGQQVELSIAATSFDWIFGDGATLSTATPGAPYPDLQVTHAYRQPGSYSTGVTVTWSADFRVNGGPWQPVGGTVATTSEPVGLQAREATPVLTD